MKSRKSKDRDSRPTLADVLSKADHVKLAALRAGLEQRVQESVGRQFQRPIEPWRERSAKVTAQPKPPSERQVISKSHRQIIGQRERSAQVIAQPKPPARQVVSKSHRQIVGQLSKTGRPVREQAPRSPTGVAAAPTAAVYETWELPGAASVREAPPVSIDADVKESMERCQIAGQGESLAERSGQALYATVGVDFGTSCTKVVVRFAYEPGSPAIAIPAPGYCRSGGDPYLWQTVVWASSDGSFAPWPEAGSTALHSLKQGLVSSRPNEVVAKVDSQPGVTRLDAATAYLAFVVRHVRGWLALNKPEMLRNRTISWFMNVGLPAANFDKIDLLDRYRAACAAALLLASSAEPVSVLSIRAIAARQEVLAARKSVEGGEKLGIAVFPEVAAEVAGFMQSTAGASGLYALVDVGAMTLDVCTFRFARREGEDDFYPLLQAGVHHLGVEAYHWYMKEGRSHEKFVAECNLRVREAIWVTKQRRDINASAWRAGNDLPLFLAGGGARNDLHKKVVEALHGWAQQQIRNEGVRILEPVIPENLEFPERGGDYARLPVAWGLSLDSPDIGRIMRPSEIEDMEPRRIRDYASNYPSKDQV